MGAKSLLSLFCSVLSSVHGFAFLSQSAPARTRRLGCEPFANFATPGGAACSHPDSAKRRELILSILIASAGSTVASPRIAGAVNVVDSSSEAESLYAWENMPQIMKPPLDDRDYFAYVMENGLRLVLISDPSAIELAAATDVHVGACSDPIGLAGRSHFCEHMLFLGTKLFPKEDSFEEFLAANGGSSNAFTASEDTVYYFTMQAESDAKMLEGLKRFGSFFSCPLFTESATGRELNAIESEHAKNLQSDSFRVYQIEKSRQNVDHPHSKFFTGNKKTLLEDSAKNGLVLRDELIKFYTTYYSAVVGPQSLDELKKICEASFGKIPNKNIEKPEASWQGVPPFQGQSVIPSFGYIVKLVPVQAIRQITITWPIVYENFLDKSNALLTKQANYVAHLIGHEGPKSLLSSLKAKGWVNSVTASGESELSDYETFEVTIGLTRGGLDSVDMIISTVFSYLSLLRDQLIPDYVFNEVLQLEELQWRYASKGDVSGYVQSLATSLQKYPPSLCVAGPRRLALSVDEKTLETSNSPRTSFPRSQLDFTRGLAHQFLDQLTVDNSIITVISKSFEGQTNQKEKWYGTEFKVDRIPDATMNAWRHPPNPKRLNLGFPRPNRFIPSESGLRVKVPPPVAEKGRRKSFEERVSARVPPEIIRDDGPAGRWTVYYKADDQFGQPKAFLIFQLLTKEVSSNAKKAALANLYELALSDKLTEYAYDAGLAGLTYDVQIVPRGVRLTFGGYNDKLKEFVAYVSRKAALEFDDILPKTDREFERYKDLLSRTFAGFDVKQPYSHCTSFSQLLLNPITFQYSNQDLRQAAAAITMDELRAYATSLWSSGKGLALIHGNLDKGEAEEIVNTIDRTLRFQPISSEDFPPELAPLPLPPITAQGKPTRLVVSEPNAENSNSASYVVLQSLSEDPKEHVLIELLSAIIAERFYEDLRTKQQLGYIVSSGVRGLGKTRYLGFIVQSSVATNEKLTKEMFTFLDGVRPNFLEKLPKGDFAVYVKSLIDRKTEPDKQLSTEVTRNWGEIGSGRLQFNRSQLEVAAALEVSKEDLLEFWDDLYVNDGRRVLVTEVVPKIGPASTNEPPKSTGYDGSQEISTLGIDDIPKFREARENYLYLASNKAR